MKCKFCQSENIEEIMLITQCYHIDDMSFTDKDAYLCEDCGRITLVSKRR